MGVERRQIVQQIERFNLKSFPAVVTGVGEPDENDIKRVGFREVSFNYGLDFPPDNYETGLQVVPGALSFDETHPFAAVDMTGKDINENDVVWITESFHASTGLPVYYISDGKELEFCIDELPTPAANTVHVEADPENFDHRFVMPGCMYFTPDDELAPFVTIDPDKMFVMDDEPAGEDISGSTVWATGDMALDGEGKLQPRLGLNVCLEDPVTPEPGEVQVEVKGTVQDGQLCWWANVPEGVDNITGDNTWTNRDGDVIEHIGPDEEPHTEPLKWDGQVVTDIEPNAFEDHWDCVGFKVTKRGVKVDARGHVIVGAEFSEWLGLEDV